MQVGQENVEAPVLIVGDYLFEPEIGLISGPGGAHRVCAQTSALLWYLVERHGKAVAREDLVRDVWHDAPGAARALTSGIARLRHYLGDTAKDARYIETVPAKGYRLVAAVYGGSRGRAEAEPAPKTGEKTRSTRRLARFILELRDRKVCRAMLLYALSVWLIAQVSEIIAPALLLPEWFTTFVVVVGILGFPVAALLAWVFEIKPGGIFIDVPRLPATQEAPPRRRVDFAVDMSMIVCAVLLSGQLFVNTLSGEAVALPDESVAVVDEEPAGTTVHRIAVSPLSLSGASVEANAVGHRFIDLMIHSLLAHEEFTVSWRDQAPSTTPLQEYGRVDSVLKGFVFSDGDQLSISVYLLDARTNVYLLSRVLPVTELTDDALEREVEATTLEILRVISSSETDEEDPRRFAQKAAPPMSF